MEAYLDGVALGVKAVAIYRDGCKRTQPLNTRAGREGARSRRWSRRGRCAAACRRTAARCATSSISPATRATSTSACTTTASPGELFIKIAKEGSTISGLMDTIGILTSMALQYGVPLDVLVSKFSHVRFEPSGFTKNPGDPARQVADRLHLPLPRREVPQPRSARGGGPRVAGSRRRGCGARADGGAGGDAGADAAVVESARLQPAIGRAELRRLRRDHDSQRQLLQMPELRRDERVLVRRDLSRDRVSGNAGSGGAVVVSGFPEVVVGMVAGGSRRGAPSGAPRRWRLLPTSRPLYGLTLRRSSAERRSA